MWRQVRHVIAKEVAQLRRNPQALRILLLAPVIQMLAFGYAATTDVKEIPFVLLDLDRTPASRSLVDRFTGSGYFRLVGVEAAPARLDRWLLHGDADLALAIPAGYERALADGRGTTAQLLVNGTDSNSSMRGMAYAGQIVGSLSAELAGARTAAGAASGAGPGAGLRPGRVQVVPRVWYNPDLLSRWYMVPAVLAQLLMVVVMTLTAMAVVREREIGTLEQLLVTPLDPRALLIGKLAPYAVIGLIEILLVTSVAVGWFRVPLRGSLFVLFGLGGLFVLVTLALGLFVSTVARTQQQAMMTTTFFVMVPMIYLSGLFFPIENMPRAVQAVTWLIPLRYFAEIVRGVFLKGAGLDTLWPDALALALFAAALLFLAARRFRKTLD